MKRGKPEKYFKIAVAIQNMVEGAGMKRGGRLPSEVELARRFECSHLTIRKALAVLEQEHFIHKIPSKGSFVGADPHRREVRHRGGIVGFICPYGDSYYYELFQEVQNRLAGRGLTPLLCVSDGNRDGEQRLFGLIDQGLIDAVVTVPDAANQTLYRQLEVPLLFFDDYLEGLEVPCIINDDFQGAIHVARYLHDLGHRRIAYVGDIADRAELHRLEGFKHYCAQSGIEIAKDYLKPVAPGREWGCFAAGELFALPVPPTAVFCGNDTTAAGVMRYCRENRIEVPKDCSVAAFGDSTVAEDLGLTSANQHRSRIADAIVRHLDTLLDGRTPPLRTVIQADLMVRGSTGAIRA